MRGHGIRLGRPSTPIPDQTACVLAVAYDVFHVGEISLTLGAHGLGGTGPNGPIDLWAGLGRWAE